MLDIHALSKSYGGIVALRDCDLSVADGKVTGIIGPNGAGKSTLLNLIGGAVPADRGRIIFEGADVTGLPPHHRARLGLVRTFQISRELSQLTVFENLMLAGSREEVEDPLAPFLRARWVREEQRKTAARAFALLERVNLTPLADDAAGSLSGGQKKLLELVRALMLEPRVVLLDEPAAGVSPPMVQELITAIKGFRRDGITFAIVEHDMELVAELCDHVYVLAEGTVLTEGSYQKVTADTRVVEAYLGGVV